eukprot:2504781-Heterocapsa_arctica.AAC.1
MQSEGKTHLPSPTDQPQTEETKRGSELPARRGANPLLSLLRVEMRTTQEGLPRTTHFKGGVLQAPLKDPHLWLQDQESPQPPR